MNKENNLLLIEESQKSIVKTTESKFGRFIRFFKSSQQQPIENTNTHSLCQTNPAKSSTIVEEMKMEFSSSGGDEDGRGSTSLSESLDTYSPASSPKEMSTKLNRQNLSVVESTSFHDTTNNKSDDENDDNEEEEEEINERSFLSKKFNTMRDNVKVETINLFKYNTVSRVVDAKTNILKPFNTLNNNGVSSFKSNNGTPRLNDQRKNNTNNDLPEDCSQGN